MPNTQSTSVTIDFGGLGCIVAAVLSALKWHSFWWALLHFCCGWLYVIYYLCRFGLRHIG